MLTADPQTRLAWERAEIERSSSEAVRVARRVRPTPRSILARYAHPPAATPYPLEYAYHLAGAVEGKHVLDLGCGSGQDASILAARGAQVSAMDISPDLLALTARRARLDGLASAIAPICGSAHAIPLDDASVDLVFGIAILHHLDLEATAREVRRVLKPGGRAVFKEPLRDSRLLAGLRRLVPYRQPDLSPFERPLRFDEIRAFAAHFRSWRHREFELPVIPLVRLLKVRSALADRIQRWDRAALDRSGLLSRLATVIVFEVTR